MSDRRPSTEALRQPAAIWLIVTIVGPSLLLSLAGFWALHVQDDLNTQAARRRAAVLLADLDSQLQQQLRAQRQEAARQTRDHSSLRGLNTSASKDSRMPSSPTLPTGWCGLHPRA